MIVVLAPAGRVAAIAIGQLDDFAVDLEGWTQGREPTDGAGLTHLAGGGPAGSGDAFMQIVSDSIGSQRAIVAFNFTADWTGDYLGAGVVGISMSVKNLGSTALNLRVALGSGAIPDIGSWLASTNSVDLPPGAGWATIEFPLDPAALTVVQDTDGLGYQGVMSGVAAIRLLHVVTPGNRGTTITGALAVDNIRPFGVPEPSTPVLIAVVIVAKILRRRWRRQRLAPELCATSRGALARFA